MKTDFSKYLKGLDGLLVSSVANIKYLTGYSGFSETERECLLIITRNQRFIITDGRYQEAVKKLIPEYKLIETGAPGFIKQENPILKKSKLGIEENDLTVSEYNLLKKQAKKLVNFDLSAIRIIKDKVEIEKIKGSCKLADQALSFALGKLKVGVSEKEIAGEIVYFLNKKNADISFEPIVAFGPNSALPHHQSGRTKLKKNTIVLFDLGAQENNYCSDLSRTVFFGKAPDKFKQIRATVLEAQEKAFQTVKPGIKASEIDKAARDYIKSKGYPNIIHSVGHGIGIDVHESPFISPSSKETIGKNMIFTVEPGIYLPGYGGIRIEDVVLVGKNGAELISHSNRNIIEV